MRLFGRRKSKPAPAFLGAVDAVFAASTPVERLFMELFEEVYEPAIKRGRRLVGEEGARDAFQEAFAELWERRDKLQPEQLNKAYFLAAIHIQVVHQLRRDQPLVELTEELEESPDFPVVTPGPDGEIDMDPFIGAIMRAMPPRRKAAWILAKHFGYTYEQVAAEMGVSVSTVDTHLRLARESFRKGLERAGFRVTPGSAVKLIPAKSTAKTTEVDNG